MSIKIKLTKCEPVFSHKALLLEQLKSVESRINDMYSVVQNDDITITGNEVHETDMAVHQLGWAIEELTKMAGVHSDAILHHIAACSAGIVEDE